MRAWIGTVAACVVVLGAAAPATALDVGANDDTGKYAADGGAAFFARMAELGLRQTVITVRYRPSQPDVVQERELLDRAVPVALAAGLQVVFAVYPYPPRELEAGLGSPASFGAYTALLARAYPFVKQFVVGNEPNQPAFLRPQFDAGGRNASAAIAGTYLAAAYDALKAVDPLIRVVGIGLSPRGNDRPGAASNVSTSPIRFLAALGAWYRASGRTLPLMDGFSFHPYPNAATDPLDRGYPWPNAGFADLTRVKQALWDAFAGTAQPATPNGLRLHLDEVGWQVRTTGLPGYVGSENVPVTDEATQARVYGELVRRAACDPDVAEVNVFGFYDDAALEGFQAALHRVDGTPRPSAEAVRAALAEGPCPRPLRPWAPTRGVMGASAGAPGIDARGALTVEVLAGEGARATACILSARPGASPSTLARALQARARRQAHCAVGAVGSSRPLVLTLPRGTGRGRTTIGVRLEAEARGRATTLLVDPTSAVR